MRLSLTYSQYFNFKLVIVGQNTTDSILKEETKKLNYAYTMLKEKGFL